MQIKKFTAPSLREATFLMKNELGAEAIILGTRVLNNDVNFKGKVFEITAGFDEQVEENKTDEKNTPENKQTDFLTELKNISEKVYANNQRNRAKVKAAYNVANPSEEKNKATTKTLETKLKEIVTQLSENEVQKSVITSVMEQMKKYKNFLTEDNLKNYTITCLSSLIQTKTFDISAKKNKVVALVGPTGVGKTTTIAKLALIAKIIHKLDVGLISIDTYRLGALDQLRSFADVSHIDFMVAYEPDEMPALLKKFRKKDIVFIDTVGRSQKNSSQLKSNLDFLSKINIDETFLVVNSTSSTKTLYDVAQKFRLFNYNSFILSKIDEAVVPGNIINLVTKTGIPVSFLTNGQVIPDDIIAADPDFIANFIYSGQLAS